MQEKRETSRQREERHQENWTQDIGKIIRHMYGSTAMQNKNANKLISSGVDLIFSKIVEKVKERNPVNPAIEDIRRGIYELMPLSSLASHAISEGTRETFLWGAIPYSFVQGRKKPTADEKLRIEIEKILKKDANELNHSFMAGVTAIGKDYHPNSRIPSETKDYVRLLLENIINKINDKIKESNPDVLTIEGAQNIIKDILPSDMYRHAKSEGNKMVFRLENRGEKFVPQLGTKEIIEELTNARREEAAASYERSFESNGVEFKNGIISILKEAHPKLYLEPRAHKNICSYLDKLVNLIFKEIGEKHGITTDADVHNAVQIILPPIMADHAAAEGFKMINLQQKGHIGFGRVSQWQAQMSETIDLELESGVEAVTNEVHPLAKLHQMVQNLISYNLKRLSDALIKQMKEFDISDVSPADVQAAVEAVFGSSSLGDHAKSEGGKWVTLNEMGEFRFRPNKKSRTEGLRGLRRIAGE